MARDNNEILFSESEFQKFPEPTKKKLARFLSSGHFDADVSFEEMKLLRLAAGRLRHESLDSACKELEQKLEADSQDEAMFDPYCRSEELPRFTWNDRLDHISEQLKQAYHISILKDMLDKPFAFVYDVIRRRYYVTKIKKRSVRHCVSACRYLKEDAPYILTRAGFGKREKLIRYDIILNKWETIPNSKGICLQPYLVEINKNVYMFGGRSHDIQKLSTSGKWRPCAALELLIFNPMYVVVGDKLTIFDGKTVQLFDAATNKIKKFDSFSIPKGIPVNIANHACVVTNSTIVQFDEATETCTFQRLNSNLLVDAELLGAVYHERGVHVIAKKRNLCVFKISLDNFSITPVCSVEEPRSAELSLLSSCLVQSSQDYPILPFLDYDEERKFKRRNLNR